MSEISSEYIKSELLKIARLLESNYQKLLSKKLTDAEKEELTKEMISEGMSKSEIATQLMHLDKVRNQKLRESLDKLPVDWNLVYSWINGKKVKSIMDLDPEDWITSKDGNDAFKNLGIEGKMKDTSEEIMVEIIWRDETTRANQYLIKKKNDDGNWVDFKKPTNLTLLEKEIEKLNKSAPEEGDDFELKSLYKKIFDHKRPQIKDYLTNAFDQNWKLSPRAAGGYVLEFTVPGVDEEKNSQIVDEVKDKHITDKLVAFIFELAVEEGFDKKHFSIAPSFKKKDGFSLVLKHT